MKKNIFNKEKKSKKIWKKNKRKIKSKREREKKGGLMPNPHQGFVCNLKNKTHLKEVLKRFSFISEIATIPL